MWTDPSTICQECRIQRQHPTRNAFVAQWTLLTMTPFITTTVMAAWQAVDDAEALVVVLP